MEMAVRKLRGSGEVNIGLIGCGSIVEGCHLPALLSIPGVTIKWVCDSSPDRARRIARHWHAGQGFSHLSDCSDVDAVLVATPVGTRQLILDETTKRGWHALCEKPFATSVSEHREMLESAGRNGVTLGAGYMRRYYWAVEQARNMVRSKVLGPLIEVVASESGNLDRTGLDQSSYRNNAQASGGGVLMETGCHLLDEIMFVSDAKRADVEAYEQQVWDDYEVETVASGFITLRSGEQVPLQFAVSGVRPVFHGIAFRCESGEIHLRPDPAKGLEVFIGQAQPPQLELPHPHPAQNHIVTPFRREWLHFLDALRTTGEWDAEQETGLLTTDVIMQCSEMAKACYLEVQQ
jgi:predicted dehydrogenase